MTNKELIKLAYDMGAHPYSVGGMVAALQKGIEIGKEEQKAIDIDKFKSKLKSILIIAQDPTMHQERKEMEILAMIQNSLEE